ncbi:hypothetical protein [Ramlibacter sp. WS9]|uniref:hypothetical protein n=1 Tax=Ramlibacter sp. WS9 TaxID=1882741 RepID=UPI001141FD29|nr:hypothetical protein [Ramlibacter sp. WS9]ROZ69401.1 hypothetical protein EEB15_23075 [Ramlibacter sp. WS9]
MDTSLIDLDVLVEKCRDDRVKVFLVEAVNCYKSGAYRAAVVGTWIAVCFDVIEKLRELALSGDAEAEKQVEELEAIRKAADPVRALRFEKEILTLACGKFEFISHLEAIDLQRLQEDRNRCAHPSLLPDEQAYTPPAELARAHIHAAVVNLLQHAPAQGKYALERLVREIDSEYFPTEKTLAIKAFSSGPLHRPRESLVRNFVLVLVKRFLQDGISGKPKFRATAALNAVSEMHPLLYAAALQTKLQTMFRQLDDSELHRAIVFLEVAPDSWRYLRDDVRVRLQAFVQKLPPNLGLDFEFMLGFEPLRRAAEGRVSVAEKSELIGQFYLEIPTKVGDRMIGLLSNSTSDRDAEDLLLFLRQNSMDLNVTQIRDLVAGLAKNAFAMKSPQLGPFLGELRSELRARDVLSSEEFSALLAEHGLSLFAQTMSEPQEDDIPF